jgi:hypothetical protein
LRCPANDEYGVMKQAARRRVRAAVLLVVVAAIAGCEQETATAPAAPSPLERPVTILDARGTEARVLVPSAALTERGGIPGVFVLQDPTPFPPSARDAGGKRLPESRFRMVKTGKRLGNRIEILSGLAGDETVVLGNLSDVRDGSPVVVKR